MPDIDRTVDIKVAAGRGPVTAEIPLAGHASGHWRGLFGELAAKRMREVKVEGGGGGGPTWGIGPAPSRPDFHPEPMLDAVSALISEVNGLEQQSQSGATQIEAAIRSWWARQQR